MENTRRMLPFNMAMMMVLVVIITAYNVGTLMIGASWEATKIKAVSGEDESEKTEAFVLEKFRVLLGLSILNKRIKPYNGAWENGSPAPSPSPTTFEAEVPSLAPVPAPAPAVHVHSHRRPPRPRPMLPIHKFAKQQNEKDKRKMIIMGVVLSTGVVLVIFAIGVFLISRRMNRRKKVATRTASVCSEEGGDRERAKSVTTQNLASKARHEAGSDLFYINSLTTALETEASFKGISNHLNTSSAENIGNASHERTNVYHEAIQNGQIEANSSFAEEIISVHEYAESSKYESDDQNSINDGKIGGIDPHSSEDESFHSLCDSLSSSNLRLSSVSLGSFGDPVELFSPNESNRSPTSPINMPSNLPQYTFNQAQPTISIADAPHCQDDKTQPPSSPSPSPPPPPPPPPPPLSQFARISPSRFTFSTRSTIKASHSSTMLHSSSPRNSSLSLGAVEAPRYGLPSLSLTSRTPEGSSNIPPPPCPPPFLNINGNSFKGPPPPPGLPPSITPLGKDGNPLPKLKPLHWDKVRATPDRSMVWDKLRCNSFELDEETIESLFGYSLNTALNNDEGKSKSPSPIKHVLEPKRLQNITILSKALNVTDEKVCEALKQGEGLCSQQLEALIKMAPTKEEEAKLSNYKGDIIELGSAEKLVKQMLTIPYAFQRIEAMLYRTTFDDEVVHLRNSFAMLEEACKELRSNRLFLKLLEAVLRTGNRMNVGTIRGGAKAFKLDALLKLADVKGTDGKTTLLHFVVQEIIRSEGIRMSDSIMGQIDRSSKSGTVQEKEDDYRRMGLDLVSGLSTELCNVKRTASIDLDVLATSVSNLSDGMSKFNQLINRDLCASKDKFVITMKTFLSHAEHNLKGLQTEEDKVLLSVREITEYYHGDVSKEEANPLRIFVVVRDFLGMLDHVCRELKSLKTPRTPNPLAPFR